MNVENHVGPHEPGALDSPGATAAGLTPAATGKPSKGAKMANGLWLRLWVGITNSRKIQSLPDNLFRWWINLLCLSKGQDGLLPNIKDISWELRMTEAKVNQAISSLMEHGLIDAIELGFAMHDWDEWQFQSDVSTERTRRFKERQKEHKGNVPGNANGNVPETARERLARASEIRDRDQRQSTETEEPPKPPSPPKPGGALDWRKPWFDEFWRNVWIKTGKGAAERAYRKVAKTPEIAKQINAAVLEQGRSIMEHAAQHKHSILHPSTWLNQGRYMDEPPDPGKPTLPFVLAEPTEAVLSECQELYIRAGKPVADGHLGDARTLLATIAPEKLPRIPNYIKWALASGTWSDAAHTKSLLNLIRDGDWDVELTHRTLPTVNRNKSAGDAAQDEATRRFLAKRGIQA